MRKLFIATAILAIAAGSSCKKEGTAEPAKIKVKSIGDVKEHTGWDRGDSSDVGASSLRTSAPQTSAPAAKTTKPAKKKK